MKNVRIFFLALVAFFSLVALCGAEPFRWRAATEEGKLVITVEIAGGYYLNLDQLLTEIKDAEGKLPPVVSLPPKQEINDPVMGKTAILPQGKWRWVYGGNPPYRVRISFQGCKKAAPGEPAICLMPEEIVLSGNSTPLQKAEKRLSVNSIMTGKS